MIQATIQIILVAVVLIGVFTRSIANVIAHIRGQMLVRII